MKSHSAGPHGETPPRPTVLLVEDEVLIRLTVAEYLRESGFEVYEAGTAREAMAVLASDRTVDIVFTDITMPGAMDGVDLAEWVRDNWPGTSILFTSGRPDARCDQDDRRFLQKPFSLAELEARLRAALGAPL